MQADLMQCIKDILFPGVYLWRRLLAAPQHSMLAAGLLEI